MAKTELSDKQKHFCDEYLISFNAADAARKAGYSKKTAVAQGSRLLTNVNVTHYLQLKKEKAANKLEISRDKVLSEYSKIAFFDIRKIFTVDGGLKPIHELDAESAGAIAGIESFDEKTEVREEGKAVDTVVQGTLRKIKIADKVRALDSICKVLGYNAPEKFEGNFGITDKEIVFE